jgi:hypothetical protein
LPLTSGKLGADAEIQEGQGFFGAEVPIFIAGMMAVVELARSVWNFIKDVQHGGLIIDGTTNPPTIRESRALDRGAVVFISRTGEKIEVKDTRGEAPDPSTIADLLEKLTSLV